MIGGMLGRAMGGGGGNSFGQTQTAPGGRWVDVTLSTRNNPQLAEADQQVPAGFLAPALKLQSPKESKGSPPEPDDDKVVEREYERPKGKLLLYWGCGDTVRAGQPRVVDHTFSVRSTPGVVSATVTSVVPATSGVTDSSS